MRATPVTLIAVLCAGMSTLLAASSASAAQEPVGLGRADSFAILAGAGITNTGSTTVTGDIGSFPTTSQTGFGSITLLSGTNQSGDAVTQGAKEDLVTAYDDAFGRKPATDVPVELGGSTRLAGVYTSPSLGLTGTLTLDAKGSADALFIFQTGSTLITEVNSRVLLVNGASPCNVVWQVGSSATFKTGSQMVGDVLAHTSITAGTGAIFQGRLLAMNGAVTLDTNTITRGSCAPRQVTTPTTPVMMPTTPIQGPTGPGSALVVLPPGSPLDLTTGLNETSRPILDAPLRTPNGTPTSTPLTKLTGTPGVPLGSDPGTTTRAPGSPSTMTSLPVTGLSAIHLLLSGIVLLILGLSANVIGRHARPQPGYERLSATRRTWRR